jgi:hypothetical protein
MMRQGPNDTLAWVHLASGGVWWSRTRNLFLLWKVECCLQLAQGLQSLQEKVQTAGSKMVFCFPLD